MAQKLLGRTKHRIGPRKVPEEAVKKTVLVGTYKGDQLDVWPGYYNYPLTAKDRIDVESAKRVNEIWLFKGAKAGRFFAAEFIGIKTRDELKTEYNYPAKGKGHGSGKYLLFKIGKTEIYDPASGFAEKVIVRTKDFARTPKVRRQLKAYLESPDRRDPDLANLVPTILTQLPTEVLRVCEAAVQMDFYYVIDGVEKKMKELKHRKQGDDALRFIDLFAGIGGIRKGFEMACADKGIKAQCVFTSEIKSHAIEVLKQNHPDEYIHGNITQVNEKEIPDFDVLLGGFPCQAFSAVGKRLGFEDTRGTLFFDVARILKAKNPLGFVLENVEGLLVNHEMEAA